MFYNMLSLFAAKIHDLLPQCFVLILFSAIYSWFYIKTRKVNDLQAEALKSPVIKIFLCLCTNLLLIAGNPFSEFPEYKNLLIFLFCITGNIDIMIRKIPTEFLVLDILGLLSAAITHYDAIRILPCVCAGAFWMIRRNKTGIKIYVILLVIALSAAVGNIRKLLIFYSLTLMIWGISGVILRFIFKKKPDFEIPLMPVILSAFTIAKMFP